MRFSYVVPRAWSSLTQPFYVETLASIDESYIKAGGRHLLLKVMNLFYVAHLTLHWDRLFFAMLQA